MKQGYTHRGQWSINHRFLYLICYIWTLQNINGYTHTCTHTCTHALVHTHARTHTYTHVRAHMHTHVHVWTLMYTQTHTCTHICTCVHIRTLHVHVHTHTHAYVYTCMYTPPTHTYLHTCAHTCIALRAAVSNRTHRCSHESFSGPARKEGAEWPHGLSHWDRG